jgi:hypothetical protein
MKTACVCGYPNHNRRRYGQWYCGDVRKMLGVLIVSHGTGDY